MSALNQDLWGYLNARRCVLLTLIVIVIVICFSVTWSSVYPWVGSSASAFSPPRCNATTDVGRPHSSAC